MMAGIYICIDADWLGPEGECHNGPSHGGTYIVTRTKEIGGAVWFRLAGWTGWWEATAFRALIVPT